MSKTTSSSNDAETTEVEQVWGIPTESILGVTGPLHGFQAVSSSILDAFSECVRAEGESRVRALAERDPSFKQLIPYAALRCGERWLCMRRKQAGGESRLHEKRSIGVGGHIGPEDAPACSLDAVDLPNLGPRVISGLLRELQEETVVDLSEVRNVEFLGLLNDDSNDVGRVHLGLAFVIEVARPVDVRETEKLDGTWVALDDLDPEDPSLESWSQFLAGAIRSRERA